MVHIMPTSERELLQFSEILLVPGASESALRAAISRSYYAVFHQAKAFAHTQSLPVAPDTSRGSHEKVIHRFHGLAMDGKKISALLHRSKMMRVKADYHLADSVTAEESRMQVRSCRKLSDFLDTLNLI